MKRNMSVGSTQIVIPAYTNILLCSFKIQFVCKTFIICIYVCCGVYQNKKLTLQHTEF